MLLRASCVPSRCDNTDRSGSRAATSEHVTYRRQLVEERVTVANQARLLRDVDGRLSRHRLARLDVQHVWTSNLAALGCAAIRSCAPKPDVRHSRGSVAPPLL